MLTIDQFNAKRAEVADAIAERLTTDAKRDSFERSMDVAFDEHFAYQQTQAECHAMGLIDTEVAQVIYRSLGEVPGDDGWASGTDLATKVTVTMLMGELLTAKIKARRGL